MVLPGREAYTAGDAGGDKGHASQARRNGSDVIFAETHFNSILNDINEVSRYYYAYRFHQKLFEIESKFAADQIDPFGTVRYGQVLRYGKYAITSVAAQLCFKDDNSVKNIQQDLEKLLDKWVEFERYATEKWHNSRYFASYRDVTGNLVKENNFDGYYKGRTLNQDMDEFFEITMTQLMDIV